MSYGEIKKAGDVNKIGEAEYGVGKSAQTTALTSCICVVGKVDSKDEVLVIHLVMIRDEQFDNEAADQVEKIIKDSGVTADKTHVAGQIDFWGPGQPTGYDRLMEVLKNPGKDRKKAFMKDGSALLAEVDANEPSGFHINEVEAGK